MSGPQWPGSPVQAAPSAPVRPMGQPIAVLPNANEEHDNAVADQGQALDQRRTDATIGNYQREATQGAFQREDSLRKEFQSDPSVQAFEAGIPLLTAALRPRGAGNGQGDLTLVTTYAKLTDPTTGVRQGEGENVVATSPYFEATVQKFKNQFDASGFLPPAVRQNLENEVIAIMTQRRKAYDYARQRYGQDATANEIDPARVVGPHFGQQYVADLDKYNEAHHLGRFADDHDPGGANKPEMRGGLPVGTKVVPAGSQDPDNPFDRASYVKQTFGVTPDGESWLIGFWNANKGNQSLTPDSVRAAYRASGFPDVAATAETLEPAGLQERIDAAKKGVGAAAFDTTGAEKQYRDGLQAQLQKEQFDPKSGLAYADRATRGFLRGGTDELNGVGGFFHALGQGDNPIEGYKDERNLDRERQAQEIDQQGLLGHAVEFAGSVPSAFITPGGPIKSVSNAVRAGVEFGASAGFLSGNGAGDSLRSAVTGGIIGGGLGGAVQAGSPYIAAGARKVFGREAVAVADEAAAAPINAVTNGGIEPALSQADQTEIAALAKKATGWGPGARAAKKQLADRFAANPEAQAAAQRLGIEIPADVLSDNAQGQALTGLARSQVGSAADTAWKADAQRISQYAEQAMSDLGGTRDLAQLSDDVLNRLNGTAQALEDKAGVLRADVKAAIDPAARVKASNLEQVLGKTIKNYGGLSEAKAAMSGPEKELLAMLGEGATAKTPTYARLNRLRDDVGLAWAKGKGPWSDVNRTQLGEYYHALRQDQLSAVEQIGGKELADKQVAANNLFEQMYDQRAEMQDLFGKSLEGSISPKLWNAVTTGS